MRRFHLNAIVLTVSLLTVSTMAAFLTVNTSTAGVSTATASCSGAGFDADCLEVASPKASSGPQYAPRAIERFANELASQPERLKIPSLNVDSQVVPVGMLKNRSLEIPENIEILGWYRYSAQPTSPFGAMVLVGHRDGAVQGRGALYDLASLQPGDAIEVDDSLNRTARYTVIARSVISKDEFARRSADIFTTVGPKRLRLISCGGYYDAEHGGYQSNVVVTAKPVE